MLTLSKSFTTQSIASTLYESLSIRAISGISVGLRAGAIINLNGGRHPGREDDARRYLVDMDAHRNALRQAHPGEDRVDISHPLIAAASDADLVNPNPARDRGRLGTAMKIMSHFKHNVFMLDEA